MGVVVLVEVLVRLILIINCEDFTEPENLEVPHEPTNRLSLSLALVKVSADYNANSLGSDQRWAVFRAAC